jgi:hypothetical protein
MSTAELTRLQKIIIAVSALLLAPLAQIAIARGGGSGSMGGGGGGHFSGGGSRSFGGSGHFSGGVSRGFSGGSHFSGGFHQGFASSRSFSRPSMEGRSFNRGSNQPAIRSSGSMGNNRFASSSNENRSNGFPQSQFEHRQPFADRNIGVSNNSRDSSHPGDLYSMPNRRADGPSQPGDIFSASTRHNDRASFGDHRGSVFAGNSRNGISRFRDTSSRNAVFEDRDRFHNGFRDRFRDRDDFRGFHHDFFFRDRHHHFDDFIIWPSFCFPLFYDCGPYWGWSYSYPYYCQRYVFVSLGGYWPDYDYLRYYWYPYHEYGWYGYYPVPQEIGGDVTNNYYTYDSSGVTPVDESTFADVRARMQQQKPKQPAAKTSSDTLFDDGVKAFGQGSYNAAADKFANAMKLSPDDTVLPFAYSQSLFAQGQYEQAASTLRDALAKSSPEKMGVYYPRGLYLDDNTLTNQIDQLNKEVQANPNNSDTQLLLGYQQLGMGETQQAIEHLNSAQNDKNNEAAASMLLTLAEKYQTNTQQ